MLVVSYQKVLLNGASETISGSATEPTFSRAIDSDTGLYFPGDNLIAITTGGVERARFGSFIEFKADGRTVLPQEIQPTAAGSQTLNCATTSTILKYGGNATITFANMGEGQSVTVIFSSTGSAYVLNWAGETIAWAGAAKPTPTTSLSRFDFYTFQKLGGVVFAAASLNHGIV
jgi:hypothetical protein